MRRKTEHTHRPDETAPVEQALKESAARIEPDSGFVERLSMRLKHAHARSHAQQPESRPSRLPRLAWIGAAAALIVAAIGIAYLSRPDVPASPLPEAPAAPTQALTTPTAALAEAEVPAAEPTTPVAVETEPDFIADLPPVVVSSQPRHGEEVNLQAGVFVRFSRPMDRTSVEAALQVTPPITGTFTWHDDQTVSFGGKALASATRYHVTLEASARAGNGLSLGRDLTFAFSTVGPLTVTHTSPADGTLNVRGDRPVLINVNYPLVPVNCTGQAAVPGGDCAPLPLQITPEVTGQGMWVNSGVYRFDPDPVWTAGETYTVTVPGDVAGVDGAPLDAPLTFAFTTALPAVLTARPANFDHTIPLDTDVRVSFNTPMDLASAEAAFRLEDPQGRAVEGDLAWMDGATQLVFTPTTLLDPSTRYEIRVDAAARALSGVPLDEGYASHFRTTPALGVARITGGTSETQAARLDYYQSAQIGFRGLLDAATTDDAVTVRHDASGEEVQASVYWDLSPTLSTAYVNWDRLAGERYCITVEQTLADIYGNRLAEPETACFEIRDMPPAFTPVGGDAIITLDADAPATVVFSSLNADAIDLTLGSVALRDMLGYQEQVRTEPLRTLSVSPAGETNEAVIVPVELNEGEPLPTGFYGLTWMPPGQTMWRRTLRIAVVDRHVLIKASEDEALVWVTGLRSGQPVAGADVRVLAMTGTELGRGVTDADGLVRLSISGVGSLWDPLTAITGEAGRPGFGIGRTNWNRDVSPGGFGIDYNYERAPIYRGSLHTDRPIYRPDQEVQVWGVLRVDDDARYALPDEVTEVRVELRAFDGTVVEQAELPLSVSGTFEAGFSLPQDIRLGTYTLELNVAGERTAVARAELAVAAYRKPEFEVVVTPEAENVLDGEVTRLLVEAAYYSGGPIDGATVRWTVSARPATFIPEAAGQWHWSASRAMWAYWQESEIIAEGEGVTDRDGRLLVTLDADLAPLSDQETLQAQRWTLEATVTDEAGFPVSRQGEMTVHTSRVYVGMRPQTWVTGAGSSTEINLLTLDWDGLPQARERLTVTLARRTWRATPATEPYMSDTWTFEDTVVETTGVTTDGDGLATATLTPPRSGPYVVIAEGRDREGNPYSGETYLYVSGPEAAAWQVPEGRIEPVADAESYRPGDTASILLPTPFRGPFEVLMTIERGSILEVRRFTVREANPLIEVRIADEHAPNVVVTFALIKGVGAGQSTPDVRIGMVNLEVTPVNQLLDVAVEPTCTGPAPCAYEPGDTVDLTVRTTDAAGDPVDAALALSVVDKAVLALAEDRTPTLPEAFYAPRPLGVITGDSLLTLHNRVISDLEELRRNAMRYALEGMVGGIGGGGDGAATRSPDVRTDFPDTALWDPHLRTGASGEATVTLTLPDSLTTWVVRARAVTAETQVGEGTAEFIVSKPLLVRPVTPRFLVAGDRAIVAMVVHNTTDSDLGVTPRLQTNLTVDAPAPDRITVPAHGRARVAWTVVVPQAGLDLADLIFSASGGGYRDAARPAVGTEWGLPIYRYESPDVVSVSGALSSADSRVEVVIVPPEAGPGSTLTVRLSPTLAAGMLDGLDYLETFPHACTEQLVSRFLPNVASYRALRETGRRDPELEAHLTQLVAEVLTELNKRQNSDGGWGWWGRVPSDLQTSAYATLGLIMAERAGFPIDTATLSRAVDFLQRRLQLSLQQETLALSQAISLYVLSEADQAWPDDMAVRLFDERHTLEVTGRAYLALGLGLRDPDDARVTTLLDDLRADAEMTAGGAHWESTVSQYWVTPTRATAVALDALARLAPDDPLLPPAVRWLMATRHKNRWETTQETAWAVIALTDTMIATGELDAAFEWGLALNAEPLEQGTVSSANRDTPIEQIISADDLLRHWPNALEISRGDGPGTLYYTADLALSLPVEQLEAESRGITIERRVCRVTTLDRSADDDEPCEPVASARPGDLVEVRLTVIAPRTRTYVVVEAPYPAGMEPVDPTLATQQQDAEPTLGVADQPWWQRTFDYAELRDERAVFYATRLNAGVHEARFYLRAAVPGDYQLLPATASEMYFPEVWGRTAGAGFTIAP